MDKMLEAFEALANKETIIHGTAWRLGDYFEEAFSALQSALQSQQGAQEQVADELLYVQVGRLGDAIHNLGCRHQNDEELSDALSDLARTAWILRGELAQAHPQETMSELT